MELLAPPPGSDWFRVGIPVVSLRSTTGYRPGCLRHRFVVTCDAALRAMSVREAGESVW
jgi:hypothetical protein